MPCSEVTAFNVPAVRPKIVPAPQPRSIPLSDRRTWRDNHQQHTATNTPAARKTAARDTVGHRVARGFVSRAKKDGQADCRDRRPHHRPASRKPTVQGRTKKEGKDQTADDHRLYDGQRPLIAVPMRAARGPADWRSCRSAIATDARRAPATRANPAGRNACSERSMPRDAWRPSTNRTSPLRQGRSGWTGRSLHGGQGLDIDDEGLERRHVFPTQLPQPAKVTGDRQRRTSRTPTQRHPSSTRRHVPAWCADREIANDGRAVASDARGDASCRRLANGPARSTCERRPWSA